MVRLDKCVEALYDSVTTDNRTKGLQILNVMKGAISMSRSKTGECIFRTNKTEKKNLERLIKIEGRHSNYVLAQIDTNRKAVLNRWSKVLANQTSCSSQALFEELMEISGVTKRGGGHVTKPESQDSRDEGLKTLIELRLQQIEDELKKGGITKDTIPRRRLKTFEEKIAEDTKSPIHSKASTKKATPEKEFVTERKEIRSKLNLDESADEQSNQDNTIPKAPTAVLAKSKTVHLPVVRREMTVAQQTTKSADEIRHPLFERDLTDWGNWSLKDKSWIKGYIVREKTRQEDLIIRNALNKIEAELSGANQIKRQQFRQKLQHERMHRLAEMKRKEERQNEHAPLELEMSRDTAESSAETTDKAETSKNVEESPTEKPKPVKHVGFKEPLTEEGECKANNKKREATKHTLCHGNRKLLTKRCKPQANINQMPAIDENVSLTITPIR